MIFPLFAVALAQAAAGAALPLAQSSRELPTEGAGRADVETQPIEPAPIPARRFEAPPSILELRLTLGYSNVAQNGRNSPALQAGPGLTGGYRFGVRTPISIVYFFDLILASVHGFAFVTGPALRVDEIIPFSIDVGPGVVASVASSFSTGPGLVAHATFPLVSPHPSANGGRAITLGLCATFSYLVVDNLKVTSANGGFAVAF